MLGQNQNCHSYISHTKIGYLPVAARRATARRRPALIIKAPGAVIPCVILCVVGYMSDEGRISKQIFDVFYIVILKQRRNNWTDLHPVIPGAAVSQRGWALGQGWSKSLSQHWGQPLSKQSSSGVQVQKLEPRGLLLVNTFKKFHSADAVAVDTAAIINESFMVDVCCVIVRCFFCNSVRSGLDGRTNLYFMRLLMWKTTLDVWSRSWRWCDVSGRGRLHRLHQGHECRRQVIVVANRRVLRNAIKYQWR